MSDEIKRRRVVRARCPLGGDAPRVDDLCHGADTTLCGLEWGFDFCMHGYVPETCLECLSEAEAADEWDYGPLTMAGGGGP